jgi:oligopeptide/dipeptide ABC transporter ATP-binding protein
MTTPLPELPLLELVRVSRHYPLRTPMFGRANAGAPAVRAVNAVSLSVMPGEILGLVGESGSGKSTLGRLALLLETLTAGTVRFDGADPRDGGAAGLLAFRRRAQMVFQDPHASLNRSLTIGASLTSPLKVHARGLGRRTRQARIAAVLEMVGLRAEMAARYPHELSGGQRQRVGIARALALEPDLLVLDEPTSALDVSIQAQVVNLLLALQQRLGLTYLFISHDLRLVRWLCDRIAVMYLGQIVEIGPAETLWHTPRHPYTQALLAAVTEGRMAAGTSMARGEMPNPLPPPIGCAFCPRCHLAGPRCRREAPALLGGDAPTACHVYDGGVGV